MSVNITMPDKTSSQVPTWDEFAALQARVARLEQGHVTLRNAVVDRNTRGPAADEVMTGRGVGLNTDTQTGLAGAPIQHSTATAAQVGAGPIQTPHATPPIASRPPPPRAPLG